MLTPTGKPSRLSVLPDERRQILGVDKGEVFEAGVVYEITSFDGCIMLRPIGKYALPATGYPSELSDVNSIVSVGGGAHLLTAQEWEDYAGKEK